MIDAEETVAEKIAIAQGDLAQIRTNRAQTERAPEDALAADHDTTAHTQALASHDASILALEARLRGLERLGVVETHGNLVRAAGDALSARSEAQMAWDAHRAVVVNLEAELAAARRRFEAHDNVTQAAYGRYSRLLRELANFEDVHPELRTPA